MNPEPVSTMHGSRLAVWVERAAAGIELLAVAIIVVVIAAATFMYAARILLRRADSETYENFRIQIARSLLLGLEVLVAADIIRTVALRPSIGNVLVLGMLVLIRTFLSWTLLLEIESRWPWQRPEARQGAEKPPGEGTEVPTETSVR